MSVYPSASSSLSPSSSPSLFSLLCLLSSRVSHFRPLLLPFFRDFDRKHTNTVSRQQFHRVLNICKTELTHEQLRLLTQYYQNKQDKSQVDYRRFVQDVETNPVYQQQQRTEENTYNRDNKLVVSSPQSVVSVSVSSSPVCVSSVLSRLHGVCNERRLLHIIVDAVHDFDPFRKGWITDSQFRRCLSISGYQQYMSEREAAAVTQHYASPTSPNQVEYSAFLQDMISPFIPAESELPDINEPLPPFVPPSDFTHTELSPDVDSLLQQMSYLSSTRRLLLKPVFAAYDRCHSGCVSSAAFTSVLSTAFSSMRLDKEQLHALTERYNRGSKGISYEKYCGDLQQREQQYEKKLASQLEDNSYSNSLLPSSGSIRQVVSEMFASNVSLPVDSPCELKLSLRRTMDKHRLDLNNAFEDFDRLRVGSVPLSVFYRCLSMNGVRMHEQEIHLLHQCYTCTAEGREGQFNYKQFLADLSTVPRI